MGEIELFKHNEEAYKALVDSLENNNFSFIERATGTGKSYILIKYIFSKMADKRVLFVTLHDSMFKQLCNKDMPNLGVSKDQLNKLDCILYSSIPKHSAEWYVDNYDCIIFDEAHHCGSIVWGDRISEIRDLISDSPDKKMIGATATSIRFLDNYLDVAKEYFDNNVASRLYLSDAILQEILPAPFYVNLNNHSKEVLAEIKAKLLKVQNIPAFDSIRKQVEEYEKTIEKETSVPSLFKRYDVKKGEKYIVFCSSIEEIGQKQKEAQEWFKDIGEIECYQAHSKQTKSLNDEQIDKFGNDNNPDKIKLMFTVDMFNEGMHLNSVDGIIMGRRTTSPIVYLQQIGRALSFSVRRKQVKIFDLAGNATEIDYINNLYKELLALSRLETKNHPDKAEFYNRIIDRFKIIEEGSVLNSEIDSLNDYLDDNYFKRNKIEREINILKTFIETHRINFMDALKNRLLSKEIVNTYKYLQKNAGSISFDQYMILNELNVILVGYQLDADALNKIRENGSYDNSIRIEIRKLFDEYNLFYLKNNRRPDINNSDERELVLRYRNFLVERPVLTSKLLKESTYPLNVEELLMVKDYPSFNSIDEYLKKIEEKYRNLVPLDQLEKRTIVLINKIFDLDNKPIFSDIILGTEAKIDEAIMNIKEFILDNPELDISVVKVEELNKYFELLNRLQYHITDIQFLTMLEYKIPLPEKINMTFAERKEILGDYLSFAEKSEAESISRYETVMRFIQKNKRRPLENEKEYELLKSFTEGKYNGFTTKVVNALVDNGVELSLNEKIAIGKDLSDNDLKQLYLDVIKTFKNEIDVNNYNSMVMGRKIKIIHNKGIIDDKLFTLLNRTNRLVERVAGVDKESVIFNEKAFKEYLYNLRMIIPYGLVNYLSKEYNISYKKLNVGNIKLKRDFNLAHKKYIEDMDELEEFYTYIRKYGKRPPKDSDILYSRIYNYLLTSTDNDVRRYINKLTELAIQPTKTELYLARILSEQSELELYNELHNKQRNMEPMNIIEKEIYPKLRAKYYFKNKAAVVKKDFVAQVRREYVQEDKEKILKMIDENPLCVINYDDYELSTEAKIEIKKHRVACFVKFGQAQLMQRMKDQSKLYSELLSDEEQLVLKEILNSMYPSANYHSMYEEFMKLNNDIYLSRNNIDVEPFLNEYFDFIIKNKREPKKYADDPYEEELADKYEKVIELLSASEVTKLRRRVEKIMLEDAKERLFTEYIDFMNENQRAPSILSDDVTERKLAREFQDIQSSYSGEQKYKIVALQKKYQMNTMMYFMKKKGQ